MDALKFMAAKELVSEVRLMVIGLPLAVIVNAPVMLSKSETVPAVPVKFVNPSWKVLPPYHCTVSAVRVPMKLPGAIVAPLVMTNP